MISQEYIAELARRTRLPVPALQLIFGHYMF